MASAYGWGGAGLACVLLPVTTLDSRVWLAHPWCPWEQLGQETCSVGLLPSEFEIRNLFWYSWT